MSIKLKFLSVLAVVSLLGCTGNSETESLVPSTDLKRFSGVINNSSVTGAEIVARPIGKHGKFALDIEGVEEAIAKEVDEYGRYHFNVEIEDKSPYILTVFTPYLNPDPETEEIAEAEAEAYKAAKASCQLVEGCDTGDQVVGFGENYSLKPNQQWSAAVESVSEGQFVVINPITEMASTLGSTIYINDALAVTETIGDVPAANYYSNYGIVKGNSQTAGVVGLGDILSREPANLALLHKLNTNTSTAIEESIRYGALLAAWQELELEHDKNLAEGENTFQQEVIGQFLDNQGQLHHKRTAPSFQLLTLENWFTAAYENLEKVRDYHKGLNRTLPGEIALVITKFKAEIDSLVEGQLTAAEPIVNDYYLEDYADAVTKTKAMVNYLSNLQSNFATEEYRTSIKASSDLVTAETRRLSPSLDRAFQKILSIYQYYLTCTHGECDAQSEWHSADGSAGNTFVASEDKLTIIKTDGSSLAGTNLVVTQSLVFDESNPEGSTTSYTHDLFLSGVIVFDDIRLELSDFTSEDTDGIKSSVRFSFREKLEKLPLQPEKVSGGMGASVNENLVPDYIELVFPQFTLFDPSQKDTGNEVKVTGSLTALMIANTDIGDFVDEKPEIEKLGKRYNLSSVRATIVASGGSKGEITDDNDDVIQLRDNAIFFLDASASESFVSGTDSTAYFPDTVYPTFENFFKPRNGYEVGQESPYPLVISRLGTMSLPKLDADNELVEGESIDVQYIELDYEIGGLERYIVYPKVEGEDEYLGMICSARSEDEEALAGTDGFTVPVEDSEGNPVLDDDGNQLERSLMECPYRDKYEGEATPENFINQVYTKNKNLVTLREYNGQGVYRIDYLDSEGKLKEFTNNTSHYGKIEVPVVLGVDSMRLQFKPNLVNQAGASYLPQSILDVSLVWRTRDVIQVNVLMAFDAEHVINHQTGSGLPYLAVGSDSESYSVAYMTDASGNESGEYVMAWGGVEFIDGPDDTKILQKTEDEQAKDGLFAGIGSNVSYSPYSNSELEEFGNNASEEKCGFFSRGVTPTVGEDCDAIAYLTFRGLVTGSLREERDGVYVIRYIDGSWQVLGG